MCQVQNVASGKFIAFRSLSLSTADTASYQDEIVFKEINSFILLCLYDRKVLPISGNREHVHGVFSP